MTTLNLLPDRRPCEQDQNLISLINIVFLMLIFFMIAGKMNQSRIQGIELPVLDTHENATQQRMQIQIAANGEIFIDGTQANLQQVEQFINDAKLNQETTLDIQADQSLLAAELDELFALIRAAGIQRIKLYVQNSRSL